VSVLLKSFTNLLSVTWNKESKSAVSAVLIRRVVVSVFCKELLCADTVGQNPATCCLPELTVPHTHTHTILSAMSYVSLCGCLLIFLYNLFTISHAWTKQNFQYLNHLTMSLLDVSSLFNCIILRRWQCFIQSASSLHSTSPNRLYHF